MNKLNQKTLVNDLALTTGIRKSTVKAILDAWAERALVRVLHGEMPLPGGIATLKPIVRQARNGRNPKTGETLQIPSRRDLKLVCRKRLKDAVRSMDF